MDHPGAEIEPRGRQIETLGRVLLELSPVVVGAQLRDELRGVARGVDRQRLGDDEQRLRELGNGHLLAAAQRVRDVLEVD